MEGTTPATSDRQALHQIVYRWQRQDLFGSKGLGPAATSLPIADLARLTPDLAEAVTAEFGGDGAPTASTSLLHVDSLAAVVHRVASDFERGRLGNHAHVLLGTRAELTPHAVLALDGWTWRSGQPPLGDIPVGRRLDRVPCTVLDDALARQAFVLRDAARRQADALTVLLAAVLRRPTMSFSIRLADCGDDPVALLWGLFDLITVPVPGPLTFSTYETTDGETRPRFVIVPRWPSSQLWSGRQRVDPDSEASTDVFRDAAERMVARYAEDDWDTMYPLLRGLAGLRRLPPYDRAVEIREQFGAGEDFAVESALRLETPEVVPGESDALTRTSDWHDSRFAAERETGAASEPREPVAPDGPQDGAWAGERAGRQPEPTASSPIDPAGAPWGAQGDRAPAPGAVVETVDERSTPLDALPDADSGTSGATAVDRSPAPTTSAPPSPRRSQAVPRPDAELPPAPAAGVGTPLPRRSPGKARGPAADTAAGRGERRRAAPRADDEVPPGVRGFRRRSGDADAAPVDHGHTPYAAGSVAPPGDDRAAAVAGVRGEPDAPDTRSAVPASRPGGPGPSGVPGTGSAERSDARGKEAGNGVPGARSALLPDVAGSKWSSSVGVDPGAGERVGVDTGVGAETLPSADDGRDTPAAADERPVATAADPTLVEPEAFPRPGTHPQAGPPDPHSVPERPEEPPPSAGPADRGLWKQRGVYDEDIDALEFATDQLADGGADRAVAFVEDVVALAVALELADVRLLPYIAEHLPRRLDDAPRWSHRERQAVRHMLLHPVRYGDRLVEAGVSAAVVRRLLERLVRVVLTLEKDPAKPLRALARELMSERRKLAPYPVLDDVLRHSSWESAYHRELGRRWAELNPPWAEGSDAG